MNNPLVGINLRSWVAPVPRIEVVRSKLWIPFHNVTVLVHPGNDRSRVLRMEKKPNLVTATGRNMTCYLLADRAFAPSSIALGTDGSATQDGTAGLGAEVFRSLFTARRVAGSTLTWELFVTDAEANGNTLAEAGVFADENWHAGAVIPFGGTLFSRVVITPIEKTSAVSITLRWEIPLNSG